MPDSNDTPTTDGGSQPADPNATRPGATSDAGPPGAVLLSQPLTSGSRDRYSVTRLHATGGLGRVWLAHDPGMNREVALKELLPERSGLPAAAARFVREARITGQLEHPGIVPVYELAGDDTGAPFYTMRFVRGRTLGEAIAGYHQRRASGTAGALDLRELLAAFVTLCQAVAYAHSRRVIHRDLKPANVILGDFGEVILLDWGFAKVLGEPETADPNATRDALASAADPGDGVSATRYGQVLGTPANMAPRTGRGRDRSDRRAHRRVRPRRDPLRDRHRRAAVPRRDDERPARARALGSARAPDFRGSRRAEAARSGDPEVPEQSADRPVRGG
jgi:serine/threonine protein kinase